MNDELFDEPRKCPACKVVTYCDNCPVCGRRLPRSSRAMWKMTHKQDVAGEEGITNDLKHERFEERILQKMHSGYKNTVDPMGDAKHVEPEISFDQKNTRENRKDTRDLYTLTSLGAGNAVAKFIAIVVVILVSIGLIGYVSSTDIRNVFDNIDTNVPVSNSNEIISDNIHFDRSREESTISLTNMSGKVYYGNVIFYNDEDIKIDEYEDLAIFPYESFDLQVYTDEKVASFEIDESKLQELQTEAPTFSYVTFNDYGNLTVDLEKDISQTDLEILVQHMYEASTVSYFEVLYDVVIYVDGESYYECYIDDLTETVTVYPSDEAVFIQDFYEFNLMGNSLEKGITKDVNL